MKELLSSIPVRLALMGLVVVVPGLLVTNTVLQEVKALRMDVTVYNKRINGLLGLDFMALEPTATPTATPAKKAEKPVVQPSLEGKPKVEPTK